MSHSSMRLVLVFANVCALTACHHSSSQCDADCEPANDMTAVLHDLATTQDALPSIDQGPLCIAGDTFCSDAVTLSVCSADGQSSTPQTTCTFGCGSTPMPHCKVFVPSFPILPTDIASGLADTTLPAGTTYQINTDTGAITTIRAANTDPTITQTVSQITYRRVDFGDGTGAGIFSLNSFTLPAGVTAYFVGTRAGVIVAATTVTIAGVLDGRAYDAANDKVCNVAGAAGAGGFTGGAMSAADGVGSGHGYAGTMGAGGGGAGHGASGGTGGGVIGGATASAGGAIDYPEPITPIHGGSGGGAGSAMGSGGGGGGAVQLYAGTSITIGGGAAVGGIDVGGCGGWPGVTNTAGGGGGAGGAILLESPKVNLLANAVLAANGGGGGSFNGAAADQGRGGNGSLDATRPIGSAGSTGYAAAGLGAAGGSVSGGAGGTAPAGNVGGGGGAAVGIIYVGSLAGAPTVSAGAIVSPTPFTQNSSGQSVAIYGSLITQ